MKIVLVGVAAMLVAGVVHGQSKTDPVLDKLTSEFAAAFNTRDAEKVASFYADDAVVMSPRTPLITGRASIEARYRQEFEQGLRNLRLRPIESALAGAHAFEVGTSTVALDTPSGLLSASGKYVVIYKRVGDAWKIAYDIFTSD
jgi:uncharacterized protein (TIGR02246 family)